MKPQPHQNVYGGIISLPKHKFSDMHGLLRCIIRARGPRRAVESLERFGVKLSLQDFGRTWSISKSVVEQQATHGHSHEPLVCALPCCYLRVEFYEPLQRPARNGALIDPGARPIAGRRRDVPEEKEFFGLERERLKAEVLGRKR